MLQRSAWSTSILPPSTLSTGVSGLCRQQQSVDLKALIAKLQEELRTRVDEIAVFGQTVQTTIPLGPERDAALKKDFESALA
jgi:hypothetical protein